MQLRIMVFFIAAVAALFLSISSPAVFAQDASYKSIPITTTSPTSGKEMFETYCAVCHGKDGRGTGPAAAALKKAPADLTQLSIRHKGTFPELDVRQAISGQFSIDAHGSREMPVWGDLFKSLGGGSSAVVQLRIDNLTAYLKSLQK